MQPCLGNGASLSEKAVFADSGRAGEIAAGLRRVRSLVFLSSLQILLEPPIHSSSLASINPRRAGVYHDLRRILPMKQNNPRLEPHALPACWQTSRILKTYADDVMPHMWRQLIHFRWY